MPVEPLVNIMQTRLTPSSAIHAGILLLVWSAIMGGVTFIVAGESVSDGSVIEALLRDEFNLSFGIGALWLAATGSALLVAGASASRHPARALRTGRLVLRSVQAFVIITSIGVVLLVSQHSPSALRLLAAMIIVTAFALVFFLIVERFHVAWQRNF